MFELLAEICLAESPGICAWRLLPGPHACVEHRAERWIADRPALVLVGAECGALEEVLQLDMVEIAEGAFVHQGHHALANAWNAGDLGNIGFVIGEKAVAVIDAGGSRTIGEALYAAIRERTDLPIRWLVLTHMHPDHVFGAEVFREAGATLIAHANLPTALANRAEAYKAALLREVGENKAMASRVVLPDEVVTDTRSLDLGGRRLLLEAHPTAHTDNDLTALDSATGTWWMGDLVFAGHLPTIDGSVLGWLDLLDALAERPASRIVPGHGPPALPWPQGAQPMRDYLSALVAETRAAIARGESLGEATRHLGADLRNDWLLFDTFNPRNATAAYRELEWE